MIRQFALCQVHIFIFLQTAARRRRVNALGENRSVIIAHTTNRKNELKMNPCKT